MKAAKRRMASVRAALPPGGQHPADAVREAVREAQQESLECVARLSRRISHALNNMLAISRGNLALLRDSADDQDSRDMINDALASLNDAEQLSANLAALANHENFAIRALPAGEFLGTYVQRLQDRGEARWTVRLDSPDHLPAVVADARYLELALNAVVKNASEAIGDAVVGEIVLRVRVERGVQQMLHIVIADSGGGLKLRAPARPFEIGVSSKSRHSHVGIGLWFARQVMRAFGGGAQIVEAGLAGRSFVQLSLPCVTGEQQSLPIIASQ